MRINSGLLIFFAGLALYSCKSSSAVSSSSVPALLYTVPFDAVGVMSFSKGEKGLESVFDSTFIFRGLDYGNLSASEMALSFNYNGQLVPMLSVNCGKVPPDSLPDVARLCREADSLGLKHLFVSKVEIPLNAVLLCSSEAVLKSAQRHIAQGASVMDARGADQAVKKMGEQKGFIVFPAREAGKIFPLKMDLGDIENKKLIYFIRNLSEWIAILPCQDESYDVLTSQGSDKIYYMNLLDALPTGESRLKEMLPQGCTFAASIQTESIKEYLAAHRDWLDAHAKIASKGARMLDDAEKWAVSLDIKEVALLRTSDSEVLLVRPSRARKEGEIQENTASANLSLLFGDLFRLDDESCCKQCGEWMVFGSAENIGRFIESPSEPIEKWPSKGVKAVIFSQGDKARLLAVKEKSKMKLCTISVR